MDKITKEAILKEIDQLKGSLRGVEKAITSSATNAAIWVPIVVLVENRKKGLVYGDYQGLSSLGFCQKDLEVKGRDIILQHYYAHNVINREQQYQRLVSNEERAVTRIVEITDTHGKKHTFCEIVSIFHRIPEKENEQLLVALINLSSALFLQPKLETLAYKAIWSSITKRERQIIEMAAQGQKSSDIAKELEIAVGTVEKHRKNLSRKLGVDNIASLIKLMESHNLS